MTTNALKYYTVAICLCFNFVMLAQVPGNEDNNGALEGTDPAAAPINDYVWVLAAIGFVYVFLKIRALAQQESRTNK